MNKKNKKLNILSISGLPLWVMGEKKGMPSICEGVKAFIRHGHNVHFITCSPPINPFYGHNAKVKFKKEYIQEEIKIYHFFIPLLSTLNKIKNKTAPYPQHPRIELFQHIIRLFIDYTTWMLFTIGCFFKARRISKNFKPDLIYAYNEFAALTGYLLAKSYKIPNITRLFGTFLYPVCSSKFFKFRYMISYLGYKIPSKYLIVGDDGTKGDEIAKLLGIDKTRFKFWRNGVDFNIYDPTLDTEEIRKKLAIPQDIKVVLSVCGLYRWKGVNRLIEAIPKIISKEKNVLFVIVGDGPQKPILENMANKLKISNWIRFFGSANRKQIKEFMNLADIFVTLQDISNLSNVFLEAFVCRRCIITLNDNSTKGLIINGHSGILIDLINLQEKLPNIIIDLLKNETKRKQIGLNTEKIVVKKIQTWVQRGDMEVKLIEDMYKGSQNLDHSLK